MRRVSAQPRANWRREVEDLGFTYHTIDGDLYWDEGGWYEFSLAEIEDPQVTTVRSDFAYTATSGWLPWMKMGSTPGMVSWAESGRKLLKLEEAPAEQLTMLRRIHPQWFARPEPWPEFTNMYMQYKSRSLLRESP